MVKRKAGKGAARIQAHHKKEARKVRKKTPSLAAARKKRFAADRKAAREKKAWPLW